MPDRPATFTYKSVSGCELRADVHAVDEGRAPRPVLLYLHGGALITGARRWIQPLHRDRYLSAGFVLVSVDYRLAPQAKLPEIVEDLRDAHAWVRERGPDLFAADPERIGVVGHSAGGYLTLMAGFCLTPRPRALVSFYGYGDVVSEWYCLPDPFYCQQPRVSSSHARSAVAGDVVADDPDGKRGTFYLYCRQRGLWPREVGGRDPVADAAFFADYCPLRNVDPGWPPTLLLHGDRDTDVPHEQSLRMARELARNGIEHELVIIAGGGHDFDDQTGDPVVAAAFDSAVSFLSRHLSASRADASADRT